MKKNILSLLIFSLIITPFPTVLAEVLSSGGGGGGSSSGSSRAVPGYAVAIDNHKDAGSISGVNEADVVYEYPLEDGITRLMFFYNPNTEAPSSTVIGPVRSARPYFARTASERNAIFVHAGGSKQALEALAADVYNVYDMDALSTEHQYFRRDQSKNAPHNLYTSIENLSNYKSKFAYSSDEYISPWSFLDNPSIENMFERSVVKVDYDNEDYRVAWVYDHARGLYIRQVFVGNSYQDYYDSDGDIVTTKNIALQYAFSESSKEIYENQGTALMCREGLCTNGTWRKASLEDSPVFYDYKDQEFDFANGKLWISVGSNYHTHEVELSPGWNILSTPRLVEDHQFSVNETSDNFDIFLLDPSSPSAWTTMGALGQEEFTPLYGYLVNNKTGKQESLFLNYRIYVNPSERLFTRELNPGWNIVGVANPSYALRQKEGVDISANNVNRVLNSISEKVDMVIDFTSDQRDPYSVKIGKNWDAKLFSDSTRLNDLRETKAYAVFMKDVSVYNGFQNNDPVNIYNPVTIEPSVNYPIRYAYRNTRDLILMDFNINSGSPIIVNVDDLSLNLEGGYLNNSDIRNLELVCGGEIKWGNEYPVSGDNFVKTSFSLNKGENYCKIVIDITRNIDRLKNIRVSINGLADKNKWDIVGNTHKIDYIPNEISGLNITLYPY